MSTFLTGATFVARDKKVVTNSDIYDESYIMTPYLIRKLRRAGVDEYVGLLNSDGPEGTVNAMFTALHGIGKLSVFKEHIEDRILDYQCSMDSMGYIYQGPWGYKNIFVDANYRHMKLVKKHLSKDCRRQYFNNGCCKWYIDEKGCERYVSYEIADEIMSGEIISKIGPPSLKHSLDILLGEDEQFLVTPETIKKLLGVGKCLMLSLDGIEIDLVPVNIVQLPEEIRKSKVIKRRYQLLDTALMPGHIDAIKQDYVMVTRNTPITVPGMPMDIMTMPLVIKGIIKELRLKSLVIPTCKFTCLRCCDSGPFEEDHIRYHEAGAFIKDGIMTYVDDVYKFKFPIDKNKDIAECLIRFSSALIYEVSETSQSDQFGYRFACTLL